MYMVQNIQGCVCVVLQLKWTHLMNHSRGVLAFDVHELAMFNATYIQENSWNYGLRIVKSLYFTVSLYSNYNLFFILLRKWIAWYPLHSGVRNCWTVCCICNVVTLTHSWSHQSLLCRSWWSLQLLQCLVTARCPLDRHSLQVEWTEEWKKATRRLWVQYLSQSILHWNSTYDYETTERRGIFGRGVPSEDAREAVSP